MNSCEMIEKWLSVFGKGVDKRLIEDHVTSYGNLLWHLFTWGNVPCLKGDEARKAFDDLQYTKAIRFYDGYANHIEGVCVIDKISAKKVDKDKESDVYIVAKDFFMDLCSHARIGFGSLSMHKEMTKPNLPNDFVTAHTETAACLWCSFLKHEVII